MGLIDGLRAEQRTERGDCRRYGERMQKRQMFSKKRKARYHGAPRPIAAQKRAEPQPDQDTHTMFETTIAGSLPKPSWLAEPGKLWPQWKLSGDALAEGKRDATLLWIKSQEDADIDIVSDGEQSRQHFVHGFLESVDG